MSGRKKTASIMALVLTIGLILTGCDLLSGGEPPTAPFPDLPVTQIATQSVEENITTESPPEVATEAPEVAPQAAGLTYTIVDTGQTYCY
ncbi:MAG: hypothetical protein PVF74_05805, partial [Anaerolineales bacterium]